MTSSTGFRTEPAKKRTSLEERLRPYGWAVLAVAAGLALRETLTPVLPTGLPFITLFPAVFVAAYFGGLGPSLLATVLSVLGGLYLFIEPRFTLSLTQPTAQFGVALFFMSGVLTGWLGESRLRAHRTVSVSIRRAQAEAARAEEEAVRAEEEATRAEEETLRAEEEAARAEQETRRATRESERVERILGSITDAFVVLDRNWQIVYMNDRAARLVGGRPADYVGRSHWEAFSELVGGPFEKTYRRAMTDGLPTRVEAYYQRIDRWIEANAYPSAEGLTIVAQDVTARVRAHEANARLAAIVASSEDAIVGKQLDGTVISWNAAAERIFGYSAEEMAGQSIYRLIPRELHETERDTLRRVSRGEPVEFSETERIRKDGRRIHIALTVSPIRDSSGVVVGASSIKRDISRQKRTDAALALATAKSHDLALALDAAQTIIHDPDGRITYWSSGSARLYGWTAEEAVGRLSQELLQTVFPADKDEIKTLLLARGRWEGELTHIAKDGRRVYVASQWVLQKGEHGEAVSVTEVNTDITARRQAEERLRQSDRMEVVGQLAGGVAHEANNQMTVVLGATEFLLARSDLPEVARNDLEQVRGAAERTAAITAQLLAFSRRQVLQPQVFDVDEVVEGLEGMLRRAVGERSILQLRLRAGSCRVKADPGQLAQVLLNLVLNARDAMPLGGRVSIETGTTELTDQYGVIHPGVEIRPGPYTVLSISDTGLGMSPETMLHLFEPFYTTKPVGKGTGLGLATVYGIIKQSGGYVWAYSEPGKGTTFKVYLPVDPGSIQLAASSPPLARASGEHVLIVEDEPSVRYMTSRALKEHGYSVIEAGNGQEALSLVEEANGALDLIITDVIIPGLDGAELARRAASVKPGLPILFMSGYTDDDIVRRGLLDPEQPFLQKPFTPDALVRRVAELLMQKRKQS
jgi:two-component system, cell cycle sensor histidine kinase and response regulator CckA